MTSKEAFEFHVLLIKSGVPVKTANVLTNRFFRHDLGQFSTFAVTLASAGISVGGILELCQWAKYYSIHTNWLQKQVGTFIDNARDVGEEMAMKALEERIVR